VRNRIGLAEGAAVVGGAALAEFSLQVGPFVLDLAGGDGEGDPSSGAGDAGAVEGVAAAIRFVGDGVEVGCDRPSLRPKTNQLRVLRVPAGAAGEHSLRQEAFPPNREQSFDV